MAYDYSQKSLQGLENEEKPKQCPDCKSNDIVFEKDEVLCRKCGFVFE
ncbi:hypothetical protein HYU06_04005 [Candidatus Woesearchaeota archaeon]|nr:hypothetical protein [Candidatus Woesearchaeota archaeon]